MKATGNHQKICSLFARTITLQDLIPFSEVKISERTDRREVRAKPTHLAKICKIEKL